MAVKIRLTRMGAKKSPFYRIVAVDERKKRDGRYLEKLGFLNPSNRPSQENLRLEKEAILNWLRKGAQPTLTVKQILSKEKIWEEFINEKSSEKSATKTSKKKKTRKKKMHPVSEIADRRKAQEALKKLKENLTKKKAEETEVNKQEAKEVEATAVTEEATEKEKKQEEGIKGEADPSKNSEDKKTE